MIFAIIAEGISMWGCLREINKVRHGRSYWRWFRESRQSELLVVFGEDLAALAGLALALIAIILTLVTGNPSYDAIGTIAIGALLLIIAILIGNEVKALLIGQSADPAEVKTMRTWLNERAEIKQIFSLLTMQMGSDIMVAIKAEMHSSESDRVLIDKINQVEVDFKQRFPNVLWLFFEPDVAD